MRALVLLALLGCGSHEPPGANLRDPSIPQLPCEGLGWAQRNFDSDLYLWRCELADAICYYANSGQGSLSCIPKAAP